MQIAIDGPAGAGKSTIAKLLAKKYGFIYIDTGAMYRTIALYVINKGIDVKDETAVSSVVKEPDIKLSYDNGVLSVFLNNEDVSKAIRTQEIGEGASIVSTYKAVREHLVDLQRKMANTQDVVMDGRDIGTNVLPDAELKIYLDASAYVRAVRRQKELQEKGETCDVAKIQAEIEQRDVRDKNRELNPLCMAVDAVLVDTSDMNIDEVVNRISQIYEGL